MRIMNGHEDSEWNQKDLYGLSGGTTKLHEITVFAPVMGQYVLLVILFCNDVLAHDFKSPCVD